MGEGEGASRVAVNILKKVKNCNLFHSAYTYDCKKCNLILDLSSLRGKPIKSKWNFLEKWFQSKIHFFVNELRPYLVEKYLGTKRHPILELLVLILCKFFKGLKYSLKHFGRIPFSESCTNKQFCIVTWSLSFRILW